jgi:hypothetical protein
MGMILSRRGLTTRSTSAGRPSRYEGDLFRMEGTPKVRNLGIPPSKDRKP